MKVVYLISLILIFATSCQPPTSDDIFKEMQAIEGSWKSYKGVKFNENWRFVNDHLIEGEGFSINGNDTSFFESLQIIRIRDSIYYSVIFDETIPATNFLLSDFSTHSWTFTNPENDFPSIIRYELESDSILTVTISNIRGNKEQFFYLKKTQY